MMNEPVTPNPSDLLTGNKAKAYSYIRMSTEIQLRGDSKRRQEEASRSYAEKNNLELVEGPELQDIGVSAYKGANAKNEGALGRFMAAVDDGQIPKGSFLLVESLDRLSRQEIMHSLSLFIRIVNSGVTIVTLSDDHVYQGNKTEFYDLLYSMVIMSRAHEESKMKSIRVSAAIDAKVQNAETKKVSAKCPSWLKLSEDRESFSVDANLADTVRYIFDLCDKGMGDYAIARQLNSERVKPFGRSKEWGASSVGAIIRNQATIGIWQPFKTVDGEKLPSREPIPDYFPVVIEPQQFYRCQNARAERSAKNGGGGRKGKTGIANLFKGLARCGTCGGKMLYLNKGNNAAYLTCDTAYKGGDCEKRGYPYSDFETSFLSFVKELDLSSIGNGQVQPSKTTLLFEERQSLQGELDGLQRVRDRTFDLINNNDFDSDYVAGKLRTTEDQISAVSHKIVDIDQELGAKSNWETDQDKLKKLVSDLQSKPDDYVVRSHLARVIKDQVSALSLYPFGSEEIQRQAIKELRASLTQDGVSTNDQNRLIKQTYPNVQRQRSFVVSFKRHKNQFRSAFPDPKDPTKILSAVAGDSLQFNGSLEE